MVQGTEREHHPVFPFPASSGNTDMRKEHTYEQKISHPPAGGRSVPAALDHSGAEQPERAVPGGHHSDGAGERFYDLLVDQGYCGQIQFSGLAFDIAACSGLVTAEQAKTLKESVAKAVTDAYADIREGKEAEEVPEEERPFQQKQG